MAKSSQPRAVLDSDYAIAALREIRRLSAGFVRFPDRVLTNRLADIHDVAGEALGKVRIVRQDQPHVEREDVLDFERYKRRIERQDDPPNAA